MTRAVAFVEPSDSVRDAARILRRLDVGTLPVCEGSRLVGVVTARDLAFHVVADDGNSEAPVSSMMRYPTCWAYEDEAVFEVVDRLRAEGAHSAPIIDRNENLVGMLARADLGRAPALPPLRRIPAPPAARLSASLLLLLTS